MAKKKKKRPTMYGLDHFELPKKKKKKKQPKKSKKPKKDNRVLEGYYIDDKGLKILYKKKDGGLSI